MINETPQPTCIFCEKVSEGLIEDLYPVCDQHGKDYESAEGDEVLEKIANVWRKIFTEQP